jgi:hypothetical protein
LLAIEWNPNFNLPIHHTDGIGWNISYRWKGQCLTGTHIEMGAVARAYDLVFVLQLSIP